MALAAPDLTSRVFKQNPYPEYARLRAEAPVLPTKLPDGREVWLVARYRDVVDALKDSRLGKNRRLAQAGAEIWVMKLLSPLLRPLERNMLDVDPPDHTRLRGLVHKAFTPRLIERLRDRIQSLSDELVADMLRRGRVDLVRDYALPIPATIIADLLGVPAQDRHRFHRWSSKIVTITSARDFFIALPSALAFMIYLRRLFAKRRAQPGDDLITALLQAEEAGDHLSADELLAMVFLLLVAGHETTVNLIASGTLALLEDPEAMARLRTSPELLDSGVAIEELLRHTSPVQVATERYTTTDVEIAGTRIPAASLVLPLIGSANHDETQFPEPDRLLLDRTPNAHVAFGQGIHYCLGAPLARLEGQIAITTLLRHTATLDLDVPPEALAWSKSLFLRGLERLPLRVSPTADQVTLRNSISIGSR